ncbi:hypothetical protein B0813_001053 [Candidatus Fervidibacteria bacterium JGI MDM2 SSWTFF-3-K9]
MLRREVPVWVAVAAVVVILLIVGFFYWRSSTPTQPSEPPIRMPGVPITAQPPGGPRAPIGASPMPATAQPSEIKGATTAPSPQSPK